MKKIFFGFLISTLSTLSIAGEEYKGMPKWKLSQVPTEDQAILQEKPLDDMSRYQLDGTNEEDDRALASEKDKSKKWKKSDMPEAKKWHYKEKY